MSIQPNRVIHRIVTQVHESDWPRLASRVLVSRDGGELIRVFEAPTLDRYATPLHFWVHALRDELAAVGQRADLVGAAGHALCRDQSLADWRAELSTIVLSGGGNAFEALGLADFLAGQPRAYRMLESECRRSTVVGDRQRFVAHFWGHGARPIWRCAAWLR